MAALQQRGVGKDRRRRAVGGDRPVVQHQHACADVEHEVEVADDELLLVGIADVADELPARVDEVRLPVEVVVAERLDGVLGLGGVAATPIRARATEAALEGRPWTAETVEAAAEVLAGEGTPIDDQRASAASSVSRASTQAAPAAVVSFFQNGARVFR